MLKEWRIKESNSNEKSLIKRLLASRGIVDEKDVYEFLHPLEITPSDPNNFVDMQKAVERLSKAIDNKEKIVIYGDFDADGVTSTSLLYKTFKYLGADVNYFIPDRDKEGHGINKTAIVKLMTSAKPKLIITVDCGISNLEEVSFINSFKIDVIITDHHEAPEQLPNAFAIINPKAPNSLDENLSLKEIESLTSLAGVGVAFKVAQALLAHYNKSEYIYDILPFVAIGTVADIVPLVGENRYLVTKGLELISKGKHYGIKRLFESAGYNVEKGLTSEKIAFGIAPRINASGRLDTVKDAINVLISDNKQEIEMAISNLNELNRVRQELSNTIFAQADEMLKKEGNKNPAIILCSPEWHIGIIGIVASKLVEKYYKPTFLMTYSQEKNEYRCSARGIDGISLYDVISANSELLEGFGGHTLAAGLTFSGEKTSFEQVKSALNKTIKDFIGTKELKPFVEIDLEVFPAEITTDLVEELAMLEPFGANNPAPVFMMKNLKIKEKRLIGENKDHLRLLVQAGTTEFVCLRWSLGDIALIQGDTLDIAFHPQINEYNGNTSVQLIIDDIHSEHLKEDSQKEVGLKLYDHRKKTDILPQVDDYVKNAKTTIGIFAESKAIKDSLTPFKNLTEHIFNRENIPDCDAIMFFDYPADRETLEQIIEDAHPSAIHFMNYKIKYFDDKEFLTTFIKMLRFAAHNNDGKVDILRCASALGKSYETILTLLDLLEEANFIKVAERNENFYRIELENITDLSPVLNSDKYIEVKKLAEECENFQKKLLEDDLDTLELVF